MNVKFTNTLSIWTNIPMDFFLNIIQISNDTEYIHMGSEYHYNK